VGRSLIDWRGSREDSLCDRCASSGEEAAKDARPEGRGKPSHRVRVRGEKQSSATRRGRTDWGMRERIYQGGYFVPSH
jgi:hypothetical protein